MVIGNDFPPNTTNNKSTVTNTTDSTKRIPEIISQMGNSFHSNNNNTALPSNDDNDSDILKQSNHIQNHKREISSPLFGSIAGETSLLEMELSSSEGDLPSTSSMLFPQRESPVPKRNITTNSRNTIRRENSSNDTSNNISNHPATTTPTTDIHREWLLLSKEHEELKHNFEAALSVLEV